MATARTTVRLQTRDVYRDLLEAERSHAATWPRHDRALLDDLEAGLPVVVWGFLAHTGSIVARVWPDGIAEPLNRDDPAALAFLTEQSQPIEWSTP